MSNTDVSEELVRILDSKFIWPEGMAREVIEAIAPRLRAEGHAAGLLEACQVRFTCNTDNLTGMTYEQVRQANLKKRAGEVLAALDPPKEPQP